MLYDLIIYKQHDEYFRPINKFTFINYDIKRRYNAQLYYEPSVTTSFCSIIRKLQRNTWEYI